MNERVYVFLDESGNLDFSSSGTRYFVLTSVSMKRPFQINDVLDDYKYDCIEYGIEQEYFHCAEDNQHVRDRVFGIIGSHIGDLEIHSLIAEKRKTGPSLTVDTSFYPRMLGYLLRYLLGSPLHANADEVVIVTDTIPLKRRRQTIEKSVKSTLGTMLPTNARYRIVHHDSRSHHGLQVADYCCWAIYRKWERNDQRYYGITNPAVSSEFEIFKIGSTYYY